MRHIAAYLLLQIGGNASPSAADIKKVLSAVGIEADDERLEKLIAELDGKDVNALIAEGAGKLASVRTMLSRHCDFSGTDVLRLVLGPVGRCCRCLWRCRWRRARRCRGGEGRGEGGREGQWPSELSACVQTY